MLWVEWDSVNWLADWLRLPSPPTDSVKLLSCSEQPQEDNCFKSVDFLHSSWEMLLVATQVDWELDAMTADFFSWYLNSLLWREVVAAAAVCAVNFFYCFLAAFLVCYFLDVFKVASYLQHSPCRVENSSITLALTAVDATVDASDPLLLTYPSADTYLTIWFGKGDVFWDLCWVFDWETLMSLKFFVSHFLEKIGSDVSNSPKADLLDASLIALWYLDCDVCILFLVYVVLKDVIFLVVDSVDKQRLF